MTRDFKANQGSVIVRCMIAVDLIGVLIGTGVLIRLDTAYDGAMGVAILVLCATGARFFYLAEVGDLRRAKSRLLFATINLAGALFTIFGAASWYVLDEAVGRPFGMLLIFTGVTNVAVAWRVRVASSAR